MCSECLQTPCHPRCPNAPEQPIYAECDECGDTIYEGNECYEIGDHTFCVSCVENGYKIAEV